MNPAKFSNLISNVSDPVILIEGRRTTHHSSLSQHGRASGAPRRLGIMETNIMKNEINIWSRRLQQQTRAAISEMQVSPHDGNLHFKNYDKRYSFMTIQDLLCGKLSLTDKENGQVSEFVNTDDLLDAGWAID
jgi:hypothetical protein